MSRTYFILPCQLGKPLSLKFVFFFSFGRANYQKELCISEVVRLYLERIIMTRQKKPVTSTPQRYGKVYNRIKLFLYLKNQNWVKDFGLCIWMSFSERTFCVLGYFNTLNISLIRVGIKMVDFFTCHTLTLLILAECRMPVSMSSRSSVDRAPARCSGGHGFDSCRDSDFSLSHARVMQINSFFTKKAIVWYWPRPCGCCI